MKKIYLVGIILAYLLIACNNNTHNHSDHEHAHDHTHDHVHGEDCEHVHNHDSENEHSDEIVFTKEKAVAVGLKTQLIQQSSFTGVIKTSGQIISAQGDERTLVATVPGVVTFNSTKFIEGSAVNKGQSVLSLVTSNLADGDIATRTRVTYQKAKNEYERAKELVKDKIISEREFNQLASDYETAKVAYDAINGNQQGGGVSIVSPINGYLKNLQVKEGDYVEVGQAIATISQNNRLQLRAEVSEKYYSSLPLIQSANFRTAYDNQVYRLSDLNGRILSYAKSSDANSFYIPVTFEFDNKGAVISGAFVEIYLLTSLIPNTISIPVSSLIEEQGIHSVFVQLDENYYKKQEVKTGTSNGADIQILSGLHPGDIVVTEAAYHLKLATASNTMPAHTHNH